PRIELRDVIVRGEATLVRAAQARAVRFAWHNGLLATTERLLEFGGAAMPPRPGEQALFDLEHVTLVMDRGLARLALDDAHSHLMTVDIKCTHCIYVGSASAPLVWQIGRRGVESFR